MRSLLFIFFLLVSSSRSENDNRDINSEGLIDFETSIIDNDEVFAKDLPFRSLTTDLLNNLDVRLNSRFYKDSNIVLSPIPVDSSAISSQLLFTYSGGTPRQNGPGLEYSVLYAASLFSFETDLIGYDDLINNSMSSFLEARGAFTKLESRADYRQVSGFGGSEKLEDYGLLEGQIRRSAYNIFNFETKIYREFSNLQASLGVDYDSTEFVNSSPGAGFLYDRNMILYDIELLYDAPFLARTSIGFGFNFGRESVVGSGFEDQDFLTPGLRTKWTYSQKTQFGGYLGLNKRTRSGTDFNSSDTVFGIKGRWQFLPTTSLDLDLERTVEASFSEKDENILGTKYTASLTHELGNYNLDLIYAYKTSDYSSTTNEFSAFSGRKEDLNFFKISINRPLDLGFLDESSCGVFFTQVINSGEVRNYDFKGEQIGVVLNLGF